MVLEHTVKAYDEELTRLSTLIGRMGGLAESQIEQCIQAVARRDSALAGEVVEHDKQIDLLEHEVIDSTVRMLALRQPMAGDLRHIVAALRIAPDLERIGDYSKNVAKRTIAVNQAPPMRPVFIVPRMGRVVQQMVKDVLDAYAAADATKAREVWARDAEVDEIYDSLFRELLTYMMEDPRNITPCTHLLFIAKNIERIGDLATNIAETVVFREEGKLIDLERPKSDEASFTVIAPASDDRDAEDN